LHALGLLTSTYSTKAVANISDIGFRAAVLYASPFRIATHAAKAEAEAQDAGTTNEKANRNFVINAPWRLLFAKVFKCPPAWHMQVSRIHTVAKIGIAGGC
jgi:hypothetical protein